MKKSILYKYLDDDELLRITNKIKEKEKLTAGEICVSIKEERSFSERKKTLRHIAEKEFFRLGIQNTKDKTGILIFLLLSDKQFYILADEGINKKVEQKIWDEIKDKMLAMFSHGDFCKGLIFGVEEIGNILANFFPINPEDKNELSNRITIN